MKGKYKTKIEMKNKWVKIVSFPSTNELYQIKKMIINHTELIIEINEIDVMKINKV